jgi:hypothetical protein
MSGVVADFFLHPLTFFLAFALVILLIAVFEKIGLSISADESNYQSAVQFFGFTLVLFAILGVASLIEYIVASQVLYANVPAYFAFLLFIMASGLLSGVDKKRNASMQKPDS